VRATRNRRPLKFIGCVETNCRKEALRLEKELKSHSDKKLRFIKKFKPDFDWKNLPG